MRGRATGHGGVGWGYDHTKAWARLDSILPPYMGLTRGPGSWSRQLAVALNGTTFLELGTSENTPRWDYDPVTGRTMLLIEPTRTNEWWYSNFTDTGDDLPDNWTLAAGVAGTAFNCVASAGPHGGYILRLEDVATAGRGAYVNLVGGGGSLAALTQYAASVWTRRTGAGGAGALDFVDLNPGTAGLTLSAGPHDWARLQTLATTVGGGRYVYLSAAGDPPGVVELVLPQAEQGDCASSGIYGASAADVTRAAELLTIDPAVVGRYRGTVKGRVRMDFQSTQALTVDPVVKCWANGYKLVYDPADDKLKVVVAGTKRAESAALSFARQSAIRWKVVYGAAGQQLTVSVNGGADAVTSDPTAWGDPGALAPFLGRDAASANCRPMAHGDFYSAAA